VVAPAETSPSEVARPALLDRIGIYFSIFGGVAVLAGLISHVLLLIALLGITYTLILVAIAVRDKSIRWPAWRVIIGLVLVGTSVFLYYAPPRTESFPINMAGFEDWTFGKYSLSYFPITADPQIGNEFHQSELDCDQFDADVNARCFTNGHIAGYPGAVISWVSVKGGAYNGLWIPLEAFAMGSPGLAADIPNCDSLWFKVFPFL
jgi:hypothetical protein